MIPPIEVWGWILVFGGFATLVTILGKILWDELVVPKNF